MARYSYAVHQLTSAITWWESLSGVDHANRSTVETLIATCESVFADERQSWFASSFEGAGTEDSTGEDDRDRGHKKE